MSDELRDLRIQIQAQSDQATAALTEPDVLEAHNAMMMAAFWFHRRLVEHGCPPPQAEALVVSSLVSNLAAIR